MPQINRIRVNNVKYNFGTQFYDDFMMRFNCNNTIYDLANGGGKSLLMLLLLQNVIPNCTLDEKQPIEKLFRAGCNNTTIHSMIEWKLDPCYQKDNFKYMTTGFCARKGRATEEESSGTGLSTGAGTGTAELSETDLASSVSAAKESASVEYFNYCIFYREFGDNDIRNLPLVSNGERITYNGLKNYLRELEKNDFNVSVKIFDRKGDYQNFISRYGLFESQWEIVRGINKTEGHVRTYFETNYKTSRKVVEDLLIEEIIQKSFNNTLSVENDEGRMAETLLDIKDKLVELSKKHAQMNHYDNQMAAIDDFVSYIETYQGFYENKQNLENTLFDLLCACKKASLEEKNKLEHLNGLKEKMQEELANESRCIQTAEVISEQNSLTAMEELIKASEFNRSTKDKQISELKNKLSMMESANDFKDYKQYVKACDEVTETINNAMRDHEDLLEELKCIAAIYRDQNRVKTASLKDRCDVTSENVASLQTKLTDATNERRQKDKEAASLSSLADYTDQQIKEEEVKLAKLMENSSLLVAENAQTELDELRGKLTGLKEEYATLEQKCNAGKAEQKTNEHRISEITIMNQLLKRDQERLESTGQNKLEEQGRIDELMNIYSVPQKTALEETVLGIHKALDAQLSELEIQMNELQSFIQNAKDGTYICKSPLRDKLKSYLVSQYGDDVVEGHEWFRNLSAGQKRDVAKRAPFIEYGFVIKNDFERIRQDRLLDNFERGAYAIPVISEQVLYDTKLEVNNELVAFAMKNMEFLRDDARLDSEIRLAQEELDTLTQNKEKLMDRKSIVWADYIFIISVNIRANTEGAKETLEENQLQISKNDAEKERLSRRAEELDQSITVQSTRLTEIAKQVDEDKLRFETLGKIIEMNQSISDQYTKLQEYKKNGNEASLQVEKLESEIAELTQQLEHANKDFTAASNALKQQNELWETQYLPYYEQGFEAEQKLKDLLTQMEPDKLETRFMGIKEVLEKDTSNLKDKETLRNHYKTSMEKCTKAIAYRGVDFDEIERLVNAGTVRSYDSTELLDVKKNLNEMEQSLRALDDELNSQNALMNRLEGSVAHGIHQIEEKYGEYQPFACENPDTFMKQHKQLIEKLKSNLKEMESKINAAHKASQDIFVMEKDIKEKRNF